MSGSEEYENEVLQELVRDADTREKWLDVPGVDWEPDNDGILEFTARGDAGAFYMNVEREDGRLGIHTYDDESVMLAATTEDDVYGASVTMTASEAERVAQQLLVAAHAARERGSSDVRT